MDANTTIEKIIETVGQHKGANVIPMDEPGTFGWSVFWMDDEGEEQSETYRLDISQVTTLTSSMDLFQRAALIEDRQFFARALQRAGSFLW